MIIIYANNKPKDEIKKIEDQNSQPEELTTNTKKPDHKNPKDINKKQDLEKDVDEDNAASLNDTNKYNTQQIGEEPRANKINQYIKNISYVILGLFAIVIPAALYWYNQNKPSVIKNNKKIDILSDQHTNLFQKYINQAYPDIKMNSKQIECLLAYSVREVIDKKPTEDDFTNHNYFKENLKLNEYLGKISTIFQKIHKKQILDIEELQQMVDISYNDVLKIYIKDIPYIIIDLEYQYTYNKFIKILCEFNNNHKQQENIQEIIHQSLAAVIKICNKNMILTQSEEEYLKTILDSIQHSDDHFCKRLNNMKNVQPIQDKIVATKKEQDQIIKAPQDSKSILSQHIKYYNDQYPTQHNDANVNNLNILRKFIDASNSSYIELIEIEAYINGANKKINYTNIHELFTSNLQQLLVENMRKDIESNFVKNMLDKYYQISAHDQQRLYKILQETYANNGQYYNFTNLMWLWEQYKIATDEAVDNGYINSLQELEKYYKQQSNCSAALVVQFKKDVFDEQIKIDATNSLDHYVPLIIQDLMLFTGMIHPNFKMGGSNMKSVISKYNTQVSDRVTIKELDKKSIQLDLLRKGLRLPNNTVLDDCFMMCEYALHGASRSAIKPLVYNQYNQPMTEKEIRTKCDSYMLFYFETKDTWKNTDAKRKEIFHDTVKKFKQSGLNILDNVSELSGQVYINYISAITCGIPNSVLLLPGPHDNDHISDILDELSQLDMFPDIIVEIMGDPEKYALEKMYLGYIMRFIAYTVSANGDNYQDHELWQNILKYTENFENISEKILYMILECYVYIDENNPDSEKNKPIEWVQYRYE